MAEERLREKMEKCKQEMVTYMIYRQAKVHRGGREKYRYGEMLGGRKG